MDGYFQALGVALAIGLLVGLERGWRGREMEEGQRIAGIRTFGLIGLLGGIWAILGIEFGPLVLGLSFAAFVALEVTAYAVDSRRTSNRDLGITTVVASLITFGLGALAVKGYQSEAVAVAVVVTLLLGLKPQLHGLLRRLREEELFATFKLLLISVVILPVLPNQGYGPWGALNPYLIWLLVVLIAALGFVGYFAIRIAGPRLGTLLTGAFGGLASSTAVTLNFSRLARKNRALQAVLAAGIVIAAATMFPRILLIVAIANPALVAYLWVPLVVTTLFAYGTVAWLVWANRRREVATAELRLPNPFELKPALQFGALLTVILLASRAAQEWYGDRGIYLVAVLSGITDVDAITLSLARLARNDLPMEVAALGILLAAFTNTLVKALLVAFIARGTMALRVALAFAIALAGGAAALLLMLNPLAV